MPNAFADQSPTNMLYAPSMGVGQYPETLLQMRNALAPVESEYTTPNMLRSIGRGALDLLASPYTGGLTGEAFNMLSSPASVGSRASVLRSGMGPVSEKKMFDWSPSGGSRDVKIGPTEITYGVGKDGRAEVILVKTPKAERGKGLARSAMQQMTNEADENGVDLMLNADPMDKGVSKSGLERFYKSLGFERNAGRKKDFSTRAEFIRRAVKAMGPQS